jgi:hypothetical protein
MSTEDSYTNRFRRTDFLNLGKKASVTPFRTPEPVWRKKSSLVLLGILGGDRSHIDSITLESSFDRRPLAGYSLELVFFPR